MAEQETTQTTVADPSSEKETTTTSAPEVYAGSDSKDVEHAGVAPRPTGWLYKPIKLGPISFGYYASPMFQLIMVSFVCFLCPGMFNAINGLGGGGQVDATTADQANIALYTLFCVVGFVSGSIVNRLGIKIGLGIGGIGYCIYVASFLCYNHTANSGFNIFAGAFLGFCAALLWTAQGAIMMSYPHEADKGKYIAIFWVIFNLGGVIGSLVGITYLVYRRFSDRCRSRSARTSTTAAAELSQTALMRLSSSSCLLGPLSQLCLPMPAISSARMARASY